MEYFSIPITLWTYYSRREVIWLGTTGNFWHSEVNAVSSTRTIRVVEQSFLWHNLSVWFGLSFILLLIPDICYFLVYTDSVTTTKKFCLLFVCLFVYPLQSKERDFSSKAALVVFHHQRYKETTSRPMFFCCRCVIFGVRGGIIFNFFDAIWLHIISQNQISLFIVEWLIAIKFRHICFSAFSV